MCAAMYEMEISSSVSACKWFCCKPISGLDPKRKVKLTLILMLIKSTGPIMSHLVLK